MKNGVPMFSACEVCGFVQCVPLWECNGIQWRRCLACGSDCGDREYELGLYMAPTGRDVDLQTAMAGFAGVCQILSDNRQQMPGNSILDVGCYDGACLAALRRDGWRATGFDVNPYSATGPDVVVADHFRASLFDERFAGVVSCETLEHVPDMATHLREIHNVLMPGGILALQLPKPLPSLSYSRSEAIYSVGHLRVPSMAAVRLMLMQAGFAILACSVFTHGQRWTGFAHGQRWTGKT